MTKVFFSLSSFQSDIQGNLPPDIDVLSSCRSKDTVGCAYDVTQARLPKPGYPSFCWAKSLVLLKLAKGSGVWEIKQQWQDDFSEKPADEIEGHSPL